LGSNSRLIPSSDYFRTYCSRKSAVAVGSLEEICDWLQRCEYDGLITHLCAPGGWPLAEDFENTRRGDCKDHALWAWRKLNELGIVAELMCGQVRDNKEKFQRLVPFSPQMFQQGHAWVQFQRDGTDYLFDPTSKDRSLMVRPLAAARRCYIPWFSVGPGFRRYKFWGYVCSLFELNVSQRELCGYKQTAVSDQPKADR
jgi:hypothetical protein